MVTDVYLPNIYYNHNVIKIKLNYDIIWDATHAVAHLFGISYKRSLVLPHRFEFSIPI